ncbi:MAG: hypothetical protein LLG97_06810 [Deltaproteobacteria bacterium]|nr:hypothetical protein [Deltaproteobacteria bacterium]
MSAEGIARKVPAHAARLLAPGEEVRYLTRPRLLPMCMLVFTAAVVLAVVVFSAVIEDPGFMRLLSIPALPLVGGIAAYFLHSPAILVTDHRVLSARRFVKPLSLDLENLEKTLVRQTRLGRLLGYGTLHLLFPHPPDRSEGVFLNYSLERLPDAASLAAAVSEAAGALRN